MASSTYLERIPLVVPVSRPKVTFLTRVFAFAAFLIGLHALFIYKTVLIVENKNLWFIELYVLLTGLFLMSRFLIVIFYRDEHTKVYSASAYPSVSFVIAAKNEEESIYKTVCTCLESEYPAALECIVVDDGSSDGTRREMLRARDFYNLTRGAKQVTVIGFDTNRGKREAMAEGVLAARGEIIVFVDSDSFIERSAVRHIVEHFLEDYSVGAVAGNTGVDNISTNALTKMQSARYGISFDVFKACESVFGTVTCCPGCFSAYRKTALVRVLSAWRNQTFLGTRSTFGDDRSLTNFVLKTWRVIYCRTAYAVTIVPDTYRKYFRQQLRWKKSWIREGLAAATFIWKKHIVASLSFYTNLLLPILSPFVVFNAFLIEPIFFQQWPIVFLAGVLAMGTLYGSYYFAESGNRYWWYIVPFTVLYTAIMVWQMPYALFRLKDTAWGTR